MKRLVSSRIASAKCHAAGSNSRCAAALCAGVALAALALGCAGDEDARSANAIDLSQASLGPDDASSAVGASVIRVEIVPELGSTGASGISNMLSDYSVACEWTDDRRAIVLWPCNIDCAWELFTIQIVPKDLHDLRAGLEVTKAVSFDYLQREHDGGEPKHMTQTLTTRASGGMLRARHADATVSPNTLEFEFEFDTQNGGGSNRYRGCVSLPP